MMEMINNWLRPELLWFLFGLFLMLMEFVVPGIVLSLFGLSAWVIVLLCYLTDISLNSQLFIFLVLSLTLTFTVRKKFQAFFNKNKSETVQNDFDEVIGQTALVVQDIDPNAEGKIEFNGTHWKARSDQKIQKGERVVIKNKENITYIVQKNEQS